MHAADTIFAFVNCWNIKRKVNGKQMGDVTTIHHVFPVVYDTGVMYSNSFDSQSSACGTERLKTCFHVKNTVCDVESRNANCNAIHQVPLIIYIFNANCTSLCLFFDWIKYILRYFLIRYLDFIMSFLSYVYFLSYKCRYLDVNKVYRISSAYLNFDIGR